MVSKLRFILASTKQSFQVIKHWLVNVVCLLVEVKELESTWHVPFTVRLIFTFWMILYQRWTPTWANICFKNVS